MTQASQLAQAAQIDLCGLLQNPGTDRAKLDDALQLFLSRTHDETFPISGVLARRSCNWFVNQYAEFFQPLSSKIWRNFCDGIPVDEIRRMLGLKKLLGG